MYIIYRLILINFNTNIFLQLLFSFFFQNKMKIKNCKQKIKSYNDYL